MGAEVLPTVSDERLTIELFAQAPDIVTPTGLGVDAKGRVLVVECHTHFPQKDYVGPKTDRVLMFEDTNGDGRADRRTVFYDGLNMAMDLAVGREGWVYVAERSRILRVRDTDGDGRAETVQPLLTLDTNATYPHNGLCGLCFDAQGRLHFGLGENFGQRYALRGTDDRTLRGGGEGGNVYRCEADGRGLERLATGFWNPFGICVDPFGRIFAVDNDPSASPPCRLLHVVPQGNYGYQYRYGSSGIHPFVAWDGELPDTLPMVRGVGEGPCEILHFRSPTFPREYTGELLVTSWSDHRVERHTLKPRGTSVSSTFKVLAQGGDDFRPVGMAMAPDGSLYLGDWMSSSYNVNGKGRLWRIRPKPSFKPVQAPSTGDPSNNARATLAALRTNTAPIQLLAAAAHDDPFIRHAAITGLSQLSNHIANIELTSLRKESDRLAVLLALKRRGATSRGAEFLADASPQIRFEAARWIADENLTGHRNAIAQLFEKGEPDFRLFRGYLACLDTLDGRANPDRPDPAFILKVLEDTQRPATLRAHALRLMPDQHPSLTPALLKPMLQSQHDSLREEALRKLAQQRGRAGTADLLAEFIRRPETSDNLKAEAVLGLEGSSQTNLLLQIAAGKGRSRDAALRALVGAGVPAKSIDKLAREARAEPALERLLGRPFGLPNLMVDNPNAWALPLELVAGPPDIEAGRLVFFNTTVAGCARCHTVAGRGARVGPDLSLVGRRNDQRWLLESILQPSKELAPHFRAWHITMADGAEHTGIALRRGGNSEVYLGSDGREIPLDKTKIATKRESPLSLMPEGLAQLLTLAELRDLLAFLMAQR